MTRRHAHVHRGVGGDGDGGDGGYGESALDDDPFDSASSSNGVLYSFHPRVWASAIVRGFLVACKHTRLRAVHVLLTYHDACLDDAVFSAAASHSKYAILGSDILRRSVARSFERAVCTGDADIVRALLRRCDPNAVMTDYGGVPLVQVALGRRHAAALELLLRDVRVRVTRDAWRSSVFFALDNAHRPFVSSRDDFLCMLFDDARFVDAVDVSVGGAGGGGRLLNWACQAGVVRIVERVLPVTARAHANACLEAACAHVDVLELLLRDPRVDPTHHSYAALGRASRLPSRRAFDTIRRDARVRPSASTLAAMLPRASDACADAILRDPTVDSISDALVSCLRTRVRVTPDMLTVLAGTRPTYTPDVQLQIRRRRRCLVNTMRALVRSRAVCRDVVSTFVSVFVMGCSLVDV
jgi:hypothetical protein